MTRPSTDPRTWRIHVTGALGATLRIAGFVLLWAVVAATPLEIWEQPFSGHPAWLRLYWEVVPLVGLLVLTYVVVRCVHGGLLTVPFTNRPGRDTLLGLFVAAAWLGPVLLILGAVGALSLHGRTGMELFWVYAVALLLNTITQELLVHGYVFAYLARRYSTPTAVVVTAVLFASLHAGAFGAGVFAVLNVLAAGLLFGVLRAGSGGVWLPIVVHFAWNLVAGLVFGLVVLGDPDHLIATSLHGPGWLTGGTAMLEGSALTLVVTFVLVAATARTLCARRCADGNRPTDRGDRVEPRTAAR